MLHCKLCFFHSQPGLYPNYSGTIRGSLAVKQIFIRVLLQSTKQYPFNDDTIAKHYSMCVFDVALIRPKRMHRPSLSLQEE